MTLPEFSVKQRVLMNLLTIAVVVAGLYAYLFLMPFNFFPKISTDEAYITTTYPGTSPEEVEELVTDPIEEKVLDVEGLDFVESRSEDGRSVIWIRFDPDTRRENRDIMNDLRAAIDDSGKLPDGADDPYLFEITSDEFSPVIAVTLGADLPPLVLRDVAEDLRDIMEKIPGVANVVMAGAREREIWVELDPGKLRAVGLAPSDVIRKVRTQNVNIPGGTVDEGRNEYLVRTLGQFKGPEDIEGVVLGSRPGGREILLRDVATVSDTLKSVTTITRLDGQPAIALNISKKERGDVLDITDEVKRRTRVFMAGLPLDVEYAFRGDTSIFLRERLHTLEINGIFGIILVAVCLTGFIGLRNAIFAIVGIPFTFLCAFVIMHTLGITLNMISLFSLILVLGLVVDDAIIVIENVHRHLEQGKPRVQAAIDGAREVMWPVISAVLTTVAAYLPMLIMEGMMGKFLGVIPMTVSIALLASLVEVLIVLPVHMAEFGPRARVVRRTRGLFTHLLRWYRRALGLALRYRYAVVAAVIVVAALSGAAATQLPFVLFPGEDMGLLQVQVKLPVGTRLEETDRVAREIEEAIGSLPPDEVKAVLSIVGQVVVNYRPRQRSHYAEFFIDLADKDIREKSSAEVKAAIRERIMPIPGIVSLLIVDPQGGPPTGKPVEVRVRGPHLERSMALADEVKARLSETPGVVDIADDFEPGKHELRIIPDHERAALYGLDLEQVALTVRTAVAGLRATEIKRGGQDVVEILVKFDERRVATLEDVGNIELRTRSGQRVRLASVARVKKGQGLGEIKHRDGERAVTVTADVDGAVTTAKAANDALLAGLEGFEMRYPGHSLEFGGEYQEIQDSMTSLFQAFFIALALIYTILSAQFKSFIQPLVVMFTVPFSFIGVVIGLYTVGFPFSIMSMIAIVALAGVVVNDSLILVDFINHGRAGGVGRWRSIVEAGCARMRPILLTSITTVVGLLPMATGISGGYQFWQTMAVALSSGLAFATLLTLFVIPAIYSIVDDVKSRLWRRQLLSESEIAVARSAA